MRLDLSRIATAVDVERLPSQTIGIVGAGGSAGLITQLRRSGVARFKLMDFDRVDAANLARQQHDQPDLGRPKVEALRDALRRIDDETVVIGEQANFLNLSETQLELFFGDCDLLIFATDNFAAQARGNRLALRLGIPALWIGLYPAAGGGEVIFWHPRIDACYRCLCASRYVAHAAATTPRQLDPASDGCTIFDIGLLDSIAGMLALGLLTRGSNDRFGRLIEQLGQRNFLQVQLDPTWTIQGASPVRKHLGVPATNTAFFAWNTIVRADPDGGRLPCPDCAELRGHQFGQDTNGTFWRLRPDSTDAPCGEAG